MKSEPSARARHERHILELMRSTDSRAIKNGIQSAYELLRDQPHTSTVYVKRVRYELSRHLTNRDPLITPWIYSVIAILGDEQYEPYLRSQLRSYEFDPVNRSWAVAGLASVTNDYRRVLHEIGEDATLPYRLASSMFAKSPDAIGAVHHASNDDNRLAHLWVALLFSERRANVPVAQVKELTAHRDAEVAQYALFALHKHPGTGIESVAIGPQDLANVQPRVRRWFYQLLIKDPSNLHRYGSIIEQWIMEESHSQAREGLAKAFRGVELEPTWIHTLRSWAESENDAYVLDALAQISIISDITDRRLTQVDQANEKKEQITGDPHRDPIGPGAQPVVYFVRSRVTVKKMSMQAKEIRSLTMDNRDQSVEISGAHNTIGSAGAYSSGSVSQSVTQTQELQTAGDLVELLRKVALAVQAEPSAAPQAELLELAANDVEEEAASVQEGKSSGLGRLLARVKQASLALTALVGLSTEANELVVQAQELAHRLV